jgi:hypothetical protein
VIARTLNATTKPGRRAGLSFLLSAGQEIGGIFGLLIGFACIDFLIRLVIEFLK